MKEFKGFLFYFAIMFIVGCSFFTISIYINFQSAQQKTIYFKASDEFTEFIAESRNTLSKYKNDAKTTQRLSCLNEVEKAVDRINIMQNQGLKTISEIKAEIYRISRNAEATGTDYLLYRSIAKECNFQNIESARHIVKNSENYYGVLDSRIYLYDHASMLPFSRFIRSMIIPGNKYDSILSQMEMHGKGYISGVLELVGEQNE